MVWYHICLFAIQRREIKAASLRVTQVSAYNGEWRKLASATPSVNLGVCRLQRQNSSCCLWAVEHTARRHMRALPFPLASSLDYSPYSPRFVPPTKSCFSTSASFNISRLRANAHQSLPCRRSSGSVLLAERWRQFVFGA